MQAISLFSGAGGFEIGFERAGIRTVLQAESDPWCLSVLKRHWPDTERVTDVRSVGSDQLRGRDAQVGAYRGSVDWADGQRVDGDAEPGIDLVYGGFPCQDLSVAGNRAGLGGTRSSLWHEFHRVLSELRPRWCLIENVPGLLSSGEGRDMATILGGLGELGYGWAYRVLDARWFGVPQRRRRVFIVGCLGDASRAAQVLAVCESCGGHPQARREAWEDVAASLSAGSHPASNMPGRHHEDDVNLVYALRSDASRDGEALTPSADAEGNVRLRDPGFNVYTDAPTLDGTAAHMVGPVPTEARALTARASGYRMDGETENFLVASAVRASDGHHGHSSPRGDGADNLIAFDWQAGGGGTDDSFRGKSRSYTVRKGDYAQLGATKHDAIALHLTQDPINGEDAPALGDNAYLGVSNSAGVRRLTPLECERLMGWPDEHTRYAADGREISDSHRYRLCGNGVVAPVAEWLGHRLMAVSQT